MACSRILVGAVAAALCVSMGSLDGAGVNEELAKPAARRSTVASPLEPRGSDNGAVVTAKVQRQAPLVLANLPTLHVNLKMPAAGLAASSTTSMSNTPGLSDHTYETLAVETNAPGAIGSTVLTNAEHQRTLELGDGSPATDLAALRSVATDDLSRSLAHR